MKTSLKFLTLLLLSALGIQQVQAFCGFYVAKADANLFNNKSQVILVRDGYRSVITMANDFKGDVKDFAMVVPVPVVLKREDIRVVNNNLFTMLDSYSAPRLVEYYDNNPCQPERDYMIMEDAAEMVTSVQLAVPTSARMNKDLGVKIEARYDVEEYDVLILSAKESTGLKTWLTQNGYKIPAQAEQVLDPYIRNGLKFFVVKVDMEKVGRQANGFLRPLQIAFKSDRFMLPIRLGMANSTGEQDMIVYAFTRTGRVECTNYRTVKVPTDRNIPLAVQQRGKFNQFYRDLFGKSYNREGKNAVFLEYAWDVSPVNNMKCDPCVSTAPSMANLMEAGVDWAKNNRQQGSVFFTRMHVRYGREKFPQDLIFQVTPNRERFQGRYILTHPARGGFECDAGQKYLEELQWRRKKEVDELASLTGWKHSNYRDYLTEYDRYIRPKASQRDGKKGSVWLGLPGGDHQGPHGVWMVLGVTLLIVGIGFGLTRSRTLPVPLSRKLRRL